MSTSTLGKYLEDAQQKIRNTKSTDTVFHVVMGNESADMDSIVSSMTYGYLLQQTHPDLTVVPVVNIPRADLALRADALWLLKYAKVNPQHLNFIDEVNLVELNTAKRLQLLLVDHNKLTAIQSALSDTVVGIVDHHAEENAHPCTNSKFERVVVTPIGSACTLVSELYTKAGKTMHEDVAILLGTTILVDTINFNEEIKRGTERDRKAIDGILEGLVNSPIGETQGKDAAKITKFLFGTAMEEKWNVADLSVWDSLRKDFKVFHMGPHVIGVSSVVESLQSLVLKDVGTFVAKCTEYAKLHSLDVLVIMCISKNANGEMSRDVGLIEVHGKDECYDLVAKFVQEHETMKGVEFNPTADMKEIPAVLSLVRTSYYHQGVLSSTRKTLAAELQKAIGQ